MYCEKLVECLNEGIQTVVDGKCQCLCPPGFTGDLCDEIFRIKTVDVKQWPSGSYGFLSPIGGCPTDGFATGSWTVNFYAGSISWLDISGRELVGDGPDGVYTNTTTSIEYCCRDDGVTQAIKPMSLPTDKPFVLFPYDEHCQKIEDCGGIYALTETNNELTIKSPNYPNNYDNSIECNWMIKAPEKSFIHMVIDDIQMEAENDYCYDFLEYRKNHMGQYGKRICGNNDGTYKGFLSKSNFMGLSMQTNDLITDRGFSATLHLITADEYCYNVDDDGRSYRGTVSHTQSYKTCLPWKLMTHCKNNPFVHSGFDAGLEGNNFCRNPNGIVEPWCYTNMEDCIQDACDPCLTNPCRDIYLDCEERKEDELNYCDSNPEALEGCRATCNLCDTKPLPVSMISCGQPFYDDVTASPLTRLNQSYKVGDEVTFRCLYGDGLSRRMCLSDGKWSGNGFMCAGCPYGYKQIGDECFKAVVILMDFVNAEAHCLNDGFKLLMINSLHEENVAAEFITESDVWVGRSDLAPVNYTNWGWYKKSSQKNCAVITASGKVQWKGVVCDGFNYVVCSGKNPGSGPTRCVDLQPNCNETLQDDHGACVKYPVVAEYKCPKSCGFCQQEIPLKSCGSAGTGINARRTSTDSVYYPGQTAVFECYTHMSLYSGSIYRYCQEDGTFLGDLPACYDASFLPMEVGEELLTRRYSDEEWPIVADISSIIINDGEVSEWQFYSREEGAVALQVWRTYDFKTFTLVGQNEFTAKKERNMYMKWK
ncbi:uncharacterized protein LOC141899169 [Tubulanus polymorphus]|uniref:uncharacterized protein LOC141899169 n=1 Tax=Tubulanus polymorphus TaxID=672921 RepID=UPI003DA239B8